VWHWLVAHGLYNFAVAWGVGFVLGGLLIPFVRKLLHGSKNELSKIADLLDTETSGGLGELKKLVEEILGHM
jgi:hypothetical protein